MTRNKRRLLPLLLIIALGGIGFAARAQPGPAPLALIDVNSAGKHVLESLPGIGPFEADAIIAARPFNKKNDLVDRNIISPEAYDRIKNRIVVMQR